jgi:hypothetical protein
MTGDWLRVKAGDETGHRMGSSASSPDEGLVRRRSTESIPSYGMMWDWTETDWVGVIRAAKLAASRRVKFRYPPPE